jgi:hypothetical protein
VIVLDLLMGRLGTFVGGETEIDEQYLEVSKGNDPDAS